jgi:hypothetical protein
MQFGLPDCSMINQFWLYAVYYWYWVKTYYMRRDVCSAGHRDKYIILEALHLWGYVQMSDHYLCHYWP